MTAREVVLLGGDAWRITGFVGDEWRWKRLAEDAASPNVIWHPARVPGSVVDDLARAGVLADPYFDRNSLAAEWVPQRTWVYRRTFRVDGSARGRRATLAFDGIDYEAEIFLNGERLGAHRGMFVPARFDVGERLRFDRDNVLAVAIAPAPDEVPQIGETERVRTHKARMNYGWDFCPRLPHQGLWDDVRLVLTGATRIADVWVRATPSADLARAEVEVRTALDGPDTDVRVEILGDGLRVGAGSGAAARIDVERAALWWPNGHGAQPLYECVVRAGDSDERRVAFGIRRVELAPNETSDRKARPYVFVVNGRRVYVNGWNWVPMDLLYGPERSDKLARLVELARRAHVNLFRVWGGGLIERDSFYDACDRAGVMVWQEFIQSSSGLSSEPSRDPAFVEMLRREAEVIVPRKRNHPSLVAWCGGNELADKEAPLTEDRSPALAALRDVVRALDPERAWFPSSPSGPKSSNSLENIRKVPDQLHDVHGPWEHQGLEAQCALYNAGTSLFHSEFGVEGMTNRETIDATLPAEGRWPATRQNPMWTHRGDWWINEPVVQKAFGGGIDDLETLRRCSQFLQLQGLAYAVESNRRRQWRNSGSIPWQFNEPYPNGWCTSAIDYFARPKPAYYGVARAYAPMALSASFPTFAWGGREKFAATVWVANATVKGYANVRLEWRLVGASGSEHARGSARVDVPKLAAARVVDVEPALTGVDDVFFLDLRLAELASARYVFSAATDLAPLLHIAPTELDCEPRGFEGGEDRFATRVRIRNAGARAALNVEIHDPRHVATAGWLYAEPNYFSLLPDETVEVQLEWRGDGTVRHWQLQAWNAEPRAQTTRREEIAVS